MKAANAADSLSKLLKYIGEEDVRGTDVRLSVTEQMGKLRIFEERIKVDRTLFQFFKVTVPL